MPESWRWHAATQAIKGLRRIKHYSLWRPSLFLSLLMTAGGLVAFFGVLFGLF